MTPPIRLAHIAAGDFHPGLLPGLQLWLAADGIPGAIAGQPIASWPDLSGQNHPATAPAGLQPTYGSVSLAGRPAVTFDGIDDSLTVAFTLPQPVRILAVTRYEAPWTSGNQTLLDGANNNDLRLYRSATQLNAYAGAFGPAVTTALTDWTTVSALFNGASSTLAVGPGPAATGNAGTGTAGGITLAATGNLAEPGNVSLAELLVFTPDVTPDQLASLQTYLTARWPN